METHLKRPETNSNSKKLRNEVWRFDPTLSEETTRELFPDKNEVLKVECRKSSQAFYWMFNERIWIAKSTTKYAPVNY